MLENFFLITDMFALLATVITGVLRIFHKVPTTAFLICLFVFVGILVGLLVKEFKFAYTEDTPEAFNDNPSESEDVPW